MKFGIVKPCSIAFVDKQKRGYKLSKNKLVSKGVKKVAE